MKMKEEKLFDEMFKEEDAAEVVKDAAAPAEATPATAATVADTVVDEPLKKVKASASGAVNKFVTGVKNTFRGFFIVAFVVACITAFLFYKNNVSGMVTITLPVIHLSYLRIALAAIIAAAIGIVVTSSSKK